MRAAVGNLPVGGRLDRSLPLLLAVLAAVCVVLAIGPFPAGVFQDDGIYLVLGKSLATGQGYRFLNFPGSPNATHYPPLYPLLLAGLWKLAPSFPANVTLFKFINAVLTGLAAAGAYGFARACVRLDRVPAAAASAAFTACAPVVLLSVMLLSEPMFLAALFPVLWLSERAAASGRPRDAVLAGLAAGVLALIRTLGVVILPATVLVLAWRRRWLAALLVVLAGSALLMPWQFWVAAHAAEVPEVFQGKYGSYGGWLADAVRSEGPAWVMKLAVFNLAQIVAQGWASLAVDTLPEAWRWIATVMVSAFFLGGWFRLLLRAPVTAWMVAGYFGILLVWPFMPARFTWAIWPVVGIIFALAVEAVVRWRPSRIHWRIIRWAALAAGILMAAGYARYNYLGAARGWWTQVQAMVADRARPLAEWVIANTPPDAVLATDDDALLYLYTGRHAVPNGTFTPQEHMKSQTPEFATGTLRTILAAYPVDYVLASSDYGTYAASGLVDASPPELRIVGALKVGAVFVPVREEDVGR